MIPNGVFPAVALSGGAVTLAVREGDPRVPGYLVVYRAPIVNPDALTELARFGLPAGSPCFPNLYVLDGLTWLAYHDGQRQRLRNMATGEALDEFALSNPSAFGGGYFAWTEAVQPYRVHRLNLRTGEVDQPRLGAPTGLSRILDDGRVVTVDEDRFALAGATIPAFAGPLAVGEGREGGAFWTHSSAAQGTLYKTLESFTPKCAADGDTLAITTAGSGSTRLFCGSLAALIATSQPPAPPKPAPAPVPVPQPTPEPIPMPDLNLADAVRAERAKYPAVLTIDQPAKILNAVAWAHRADGWGLSVKPNGNHVPSPQGVFVAYDILHHKPSGKIFGCFTAPPNEPLAVIVNWGEELYHNDPTGRPWLAPIAPDAVPAPAPSPTPTPPPVSSLPTLGQWIDHEYPQLVAAYQSRHNGDDPGHTWAAFQTCRRGGVMLAPGEPAWSFAEMLAWELKQ